MKHFLLIAIAFITLNSCKKETEPANTQTVLISFDVEQQYNVSRYVIETSTDQKVWIEKGAATADNTKLSTTYNVYIYQAGNGRFYLRLKSIDNDNSTQYFPGQWFTLK